MLKPTSSKTVMDIGCLKIANQIARSVLSKVLTIKNEDKMIVMEFDNGIAIANATDNQQTISTRWLRIVSDANAKVTIL